jgi:hypothetical protein
MKLRSWEGGKPGGLNAWRLGEPEFGMRKQIEINIKSLKKELTF